MGATTTATAAEIERYWIGTDLKFAITVEADSFDMSSDTSTFVVSCAGKKVEYNFSDLAFDGENYYLLIDSTDFPSGTLRLVTYAEVPDGDYVTGVRREVDAQDICEIRHPW